VWVSSAGPLGRGPRDPTWLGRVGRLDSREGVAHDSGALLHGLVGQERNQFQGREP
jgi:hypothetical protein